MAEQKVPAGVKKERKPKNYNAAYIRRKMKEYSGGQYRISKDAPSDVAKAVEAMIRSITNDSAVFAMNSGRCTIKSKDVQAALSVSGREAPQA